MVSASCRMSPVAVVNPTNPVCDSLRRLCGTHSPPAIQKDASKDSRPSRLLRSLPPAAIVTAVPPPPPQPRRTHDALGAQMANLCLRLMLAILQAAERRGFWSAAEATPPSTPLRSTASPTTSFHTTSTSVTPPSPALSFSSTRSCSTIDESLTVPASPTSPAPSPVPTAPTAKSADTTTAAATPPSTLLHPPYITSRLLRLLLHLTALPIPFSPLSVSSSSSPHLILHALFLVHRLLFSISPTNPLPECLRRDPAALLLGAVLLSEAQLSDRQTSTKVWLRVLEGESMTVQGTDGERAGRRWVGQVKRESLEVLGWSCNVTTEEYTKWLTDLRGCMGLARIPT
ncbi:hypothetical protein HK101_001266 [Irineochytrium annulatum]|nr:hypothetical protein HK101_001266 [Irineochytrium annulatum]